MSHVNKVVSWLSKRGPDRDGEAAIASANDCSVAFVGTYGPRRCGIATFCADLAAAVSRPDDEDGEPRRRVTPMVLAVTEPSGQYQYPAEVKFEIRQNIQGDYTRAAEFINYSDVRVVSIQHEYGIFGGDDGSYILDLVHALRVPAIVTLHTVLKNPSENQARIVRKLGERCAHLVVMSRVAQKLLLAGPYGLSSEKVRLIPHGIPVMDRTVGRHALKAKFGIQGRQLLLTFGLLSPNKGIETVIRALPEVVRAYPEVIYFVVGATHPAILRREGEAYRTLLEREAEKLGVREHVVFRGQFVSSDELRQYLMAADIFISPYLNEAQVTSGALSYAMGADAAVVSTPYWHAEELLAGGRGCLFPFTDDVALSKTLLSLLGSPSRLLSVRSAAGKYAQSMTWPRIGEAYLSLIDTTLRDASRRDGLSAVGGRPVPSRLPEICLDHLLRMTDDTGLIQHATYTVPARSTGYCVDDNARALIVAVQLDRSDGTAATRGLVAKYLAYLHASQLPNGSFRNFMSYARVLDSHVASDDCIGRAIWALGVTAAGAEDEGCRCLAKEMLMRALPLADTLGTRGTALVMLGIASLLAADPADAAALRTQLSDLSDRLIRRYEDNATEDWRWFEPTLTYDNALLPLALFAAYDALGQRETLRVARESLEFLEEVCFNGDRLELVGNTGWHSRGGDKACHDEQPIDAAALVMAFRFAYKVTHDRHYLSRMREAFAWFLGKNRVSLPLYDFRTGGCRDGIGQSTINQNQGAESTLCFLLSLLKLLEVAGEELQPTAPSALSPNAL